MPEEERDWDVLLTTYEVANIEKTALNKIGWRYLIIDEAHRCVGKNLTNGVMVVAPSDERGNTRFGAPISPISLLALLWFCEFGSARRWSSL